MRKAIEASVRIVPWANTGVGAERDMGEEFLMMNQLGMEPIDCLRSAPTVAAEVIGLPGAARSRQGRSVT